MIPKAFPSLSFSSSSLSLFFILILCAVCHAFGDGSNQNSHHSSFINGSETDHVALLAIKSRLHDAEEGLLASWNSSLDHCIWQGVTCGRRHRRVTVLDLSSLGLVGTLSPFIGNLSFLNILRIYNNTFQGQLPPELGHLSRLRRLVATNNSFTGQIPANLSRCSNLLIIYLANNKLTGPIPSQFGSLSKLRMFGVLGNRLSGNIEFVGNLTGLQVLSLSHNGFEGNIPDSLGRLGDLIFLGLCLNNLSGTIPPSLYNLSSLTDLWLCQNSLEGSLHQDMGLMLPHLQEVILHSNSFNGSIPSSLSNLTEILDIQLAVNQFSGKIAISGNKWPQLSSFIVDHNNLGFGGPDELNFLNSFVNCSQLQFLELSANNLGGELPSSISNFSTNLASFCVAQNQLWGSLPPGLNNLVNLYMLLFGYNQFTGTIPSSIGSLKMLSWCTFEHNKFSGYIPPSFGNLSMLSTLGLGPNRLEGHIPSTLGNCKSLLELDLQGNRLTGVIPPELFSADVPLYWIALNDNQLEDGLPAEVGESKSLVNLYVYSNHLSGEIPASLGGCTSMKVLQMEDNFFRGSIPKSLMALTSLITLDLSVNNLSGPIPSYFSSFPLQSLNLSFNNFEGTVPRGGIFANVSAVSLEGNARLCGGDAQLHLPKCVQREIRPPRVKSHVKLIMVISIPLGAAGIGTFLALLVLLSVMKKNKREGSSSESSVLQERFPKMSYEMLLKATDGFSPANLIGVGGFGSVYKGVITGSEAKEMPIAIKVLNLQRRGSSKSFLAECKALRSIRHRNLVKIVSACSSIDFKGQDFKALIYEFISNGSLEQWLYPGKATDCEQGKFQHFGLLHRVNAAIDIASALDYLHNDCESAVVHCDVKPSNILLDDNMVAHLGDFGLSRLVADVRHRHQSSSIGVKGTVGYAAPEYGLGSRVSTSGDVYSFGIILLEMMMSKRPTDPMFENGLSLHGLAEKALSDLDCLPDIIDATLFEDESRAINPSYRDNTRDQNYRKMECIASVVKIGVECSMESPEDRITIEEAIRELKLAKDILIGARDA